MIPKPVHASNAPLFIGKDVHNDGSAVTAFTRFIEASGGASAWKAVHMAKTRYNAIPVGDGKRNLLMLDDWTNGSVRYRRGFIGSGRIPKDHDGAATFSATGQSDGSPVPEYDQARTLCDHLPTAAALIVLANEQDYTLKTLDPSSCSAGSTCIAVYRLSKGRIAKQKEEEWTFSNQTGLVNGIKMKMNEPLQKLATSSAMNTFRPPVTTPFWEEVTFEEYKQQQKLTVPSELVINMPGGHSLRRRLIELQIPSQFDKVAFDSELR